MGGANHQHVASIYRLAGYDPAAPPGPEALIERLFGSGAIELAPLGPSKSTDAWLYWCDGWRVRLADGIGSEAACLAMGRSIARWFLLTRMREGTATSVVELGAAVLLPTPAVAICVALLGYTAAELAYRFCVPLEVAERRIAQLQSTPRSGMRALRRP